MRTRVPHYISIRHREIFALAEVFLPTGAGKEWQPFPSILSTMFSCFLGLASPGPGPPPPPAAAPRLGRPPTSPWRPSAPSSARRPTHAQHTCTRIPPALPPHLASTLEGTASSGTGLRTAAISMKSKTLEATRLSTVSGGTQLLLGQRVSLHHQGTLMSAR